MKLEDNGFLKVVELEAYVFWLNLYKKCSTRESVSVYEKL